MGGAPNRRPVYWLSRVTIKVVIADDETLVRTGLRMILSNSADIEVVAEAANGHAALVECRRRRPDVVLMDLRMPGLDGIEATKLLVRSPGPTVIRVVVLTTLGADDHVVEALRAGASGFLLKDADPDELVRAIRVVASGEAMLAPSVTRRLLDRFASQLSPIDQRPDPRISQLSGREVEVLRLLAQGRSNREIGDLMTLSEATIKSHVSHILTKLDLRDRTQAVIFGYEAGLIRPGASERHDSRPVSGR